MLQINQRPWEAGLEIFLFLGLAVFLVLSPALWLRPGLHEKRRDALRMAARESGAAIRVDKPPLQAVEGLVGYRWRYPQAAPGSDFTLVRDGHASDRLQEAVAGWRWRQAPLPPLSADNDRRLKEVLLTLPEDALVVASGPQGLTLWWEESPEAAAFEPSQRALVALVDQLGGSGRHRK
ncbi:preprotein translocase subunit YajC [Chromohalobacter nigrandesensis]|uniref:preprotein translocase subunit YajC n=1 Tax=Chromohalobacter nigrandesensis TaxID=119863 RepID=UPI001FF6B7E6|nr:preprotein translocase subunit YajC [Chromohalobacter nigrandesensis]MCK0746364.1 preprotein translocase subunit YajC [Chromohalobacter nigrandesensis]